MSKLKEQIKQKAIEYGFDLVGIAPVVYSPEDHDKILNWLRLGYNAEMSYMAISPRRRYDPRLFFKDTKSIVVVGVNYYKKPDYHNNRPYISIYARGKPYQDIIREMLERLLDYIRSIEPSIKGKIAVDTSPTSDKLWAQLAGIGWRGKNTVVINRKLGSFIFLGELFLNIELEPDTPETDHCADCTRCIDNCPTGALEQPSLLNVNKCISYLTVETKSDIKSPELIGNHLFGCDTCQLVCPYNQNNDEAKVPEFRAQFSGSPEISELDDLTEAEFKNRYQGTILSEYGYEKISRNAGIISRNLNHIHNGS